jgi:hypothetical protein
MKTNTILPVQSYFKPFLFKDMFDMAYELGAQTTITNRQGLTTLTLAAQMAKKQMFYHILNINRDVYWRVGIIIYRFSNEHIR